MSAAIAATVVGAGATIYGANQARKAGKEAANGAQAAAGVSERQFDIANKLSANQRNIGNQALNALGARYGFTPALGFGADYDPYSLAPDLTSRGVGKQILGQADVRELIKKGLSIDDVLKIGILDPGSDGKKLKGLNLDPRDLQRLKSGTFSDQYLAANRPQGPTGTGLPAQFRPAFQNSGVQATNGGEFMGGSSTNPQVDPNAPTSNLDRLRQLAQSDPDLQRLAGPVDYSLAAFEASPDYQFRLKEGLDAVQSSAAARGGLYSGNALRGITDFASGLASGEYNDFVGRQESKRGQEFTRRLGLLESDFGRQSQFDQLQRNFSDSDFNRLASLAGIGNTATAQLNGIGVQTAGNIGNALIDAGNARASGIEGSTNALLGGASNLTSLAGFLSNRGNQRASGVNALAGGFDAFRGVPTNQRFE